MRTITCDNSYWHVKSGIIKKLENIPNVLNHDNANRAGIQQWELFAFSVFLPRTVFSGILKVQGRYSYKRCRIPQYGCKILFAFHSPLTLPSRTGSL